MRRRRSWLLLLTLVLIAGAVWCGVSWYRRSKREAAARVRADKAIAHWHRELMSDLPAAQQAEWREIAGRRPAVLLRVCVAERTVDDALDDSDD